MLCDGADGATAKQESACPCRFDIVLVLEDARDPEWDAQVASHVLHAHAEQHQAAAGGQHTTPPGRAKLTTPPAIAAALWQSQGQGRPLAISPPGVCAGAINPHPGTVTGHAQQDGSSSSSSPWSVEMIRHYIAWRRDAAPPIMSEDAESILGAYYAAVRRAVNAGEGRGAARCTLRALEALIRTAQVSRQCCALDRPRTAKG